MRSFLFVGLPLAFANESEVCSADGVCAQDEATLLQMHGLRAAKNKHSVTSGRTYRSLNKGPFVFVHDGHCAGGWLGGNTNKEDVVACAEHCNSVADCGFFAFCEGPDGCDGSTNCAVYSEAGNCPDDNNWGAYNAFEVLPADQIQGCLRNPRELTEAAGADVRCCSMDGTSCNSGNFPRTFTFGDGSSSEGRECNAGQCRNVDDTWCHDDVSLAEAQQICAANGERLCTKAEIESHVCCGTGCMHNAHLIWYSDDLSYGHNVVAENTKCPHNHGDRLFREPSSGSGDVSLDECRAMCANTDGCKAYSHGPWQGAYVCMGCTTTENAQTHTPFTLYNLGETGCNDRYEAEEADIREGGQIDTNHAGYTGSGFWNYVGNDGVLEWVLPSCSGGQATLSFRYALSSGDRPLIVSVNGNVVEDSLSTPATGSWDIKYSRASVTVNLIPGDNRVRLATGDQSGANVDSLYVLTGIPEYTMAPYGDAACPAGKDVTTAEECREAHRQLGLELAPEWNGQHGGIPSACSNREYNWGGQHHFHFDTKAIGAGVAREDLAPVCTL